jgi:hypothetical protein
MKIAMMSRWNVTCGISVHAELIGREWVRTGRKLTVFAPRNYIWTTSIDVEDEGYVIRCYDDPERGYRGGSRKIKYSEVRYFNSEPFLEADYDFFIVQGLEILPILDLLKIYPKIRKKAKTVLVIHESYLPEDPDFYRFDWDAITCFDERYKKILTQKFPSEKIHIIPYPCHPVCRGNREKVRSSLNLPLDKKIAFSYGRQWQGEYLAYLFVLRRLSKKYPLQYLVVRSNGDLNINGKYSFVEVRMERPYVDKLYDYLHAADVFLLPKFDSPNIVVSSTLFLCMGAMTPCVVPEISYAYMLNKEVIKYRDVIDLEDRIAEIFKDERIVENTLKAAEKYVTLSSTEKIADMYINLFKSL